MATLVIDRAGGFYKDRLRSYRVFVDGESVGELGEFAHLEHEVAAGDHNLEVKIDLFCSRRLDVTVNVDDTIHFICAAGKVKPFEPLAGYVKLWEGELPSVASPNLDPRPGLF